MTGHHDCAAVDLLRNSWLSADAWPDMCHGKRTMRPGKRAREGLWGAKVMFTCIQNGCPGTPAITALLMSLPSWNSDWKMRSNPAMKGSGDLKHSTSMSRYRPPYACRMNGRTASPAQKSSIVRSMLNSGEHWAASEWPAKLIREQAMGKEPPLKSSLPSALHEFECQVSGLRTQATKFLEPSLPLSPPSHFVNLNASEIVPRLGYNMRRISAVEFQQNHCRYAVHSMQIARLNACLTSPGHVADVQHCRGSKAVRPLSWTPLADESCFESRILRGAPAKMQQMHWQEGSTRWKSCLAGHIKAVD